MSSISPEHVVSSKTIEVLFWRVFILTQKQRCCIGLAKRFIEFFPKLALVALKLVVFNLIWNNFVRLYCDSFHINVHFKKSKLVDFCVSILILKMEEKVFSVLLFLCFIILRKTKMQLKCKKKVSVVYKEGTVISVIYHQKKASKLQISKSRVERHLHQFGYVHCFDVWVSHKSSEK